LSYAHAQYAQSLADFGAPRSLPRCGGWVLERPVPGCGGRRDAVGCYPLFRCRDWSALADDLADLRRDGLVSLVLVADPLGGAPAAGFDAVFGDLARPWKQHHLVDLGRGDEPGSTHHRRNARRFLRHAHIEICPDPPAELDTWCRLYGELVQRHGVTGMARFSREGFARQLDLPGLLLIKAVTDDGATAGMQMWLTEDDRAWHHLSGYAPEGYRWGGASYALVQAALAELARRRVQVADLGAGAGLDAEARDGLTAFKAGWSTRTAPAWLCGAVLDHAAYLDLCAGRTGAYFPLYRDPAASAALEPEAVHADSR
jgi:hypothetical protein